MPSPIIVSTAAATMRVGSNGRRRVMRRYLNLTVDRRAPAAPDVDGDEQEQPDDVDEMPVPGRCFKTEMLARREVAFVGTVQADGQENGADDDVEAVESGRHEEG